MKKLSVEKMENVEGGSLLSMCFWSPFRILLAGGADGGANAALEVGFQTYCWNN